MRISKQDNMRMTKIQITTLMDRNKKSTDIWYKLYKVLRGTINQKTPG